MPCSSCLTDSPVRQVFIRYCIEYGVFLDSIHCTATFYRLDGPGLETRWGRDFSHPLGAHIAPYKMSTESLSWESGGQSAAFTAHPHLVQSGNNEQTYSSPWNWTLSLLFKEYSNWVGSSGLMLAPGFIGIYQTVWTLKEGTHTLTQGVVMYVCFPFPFEQESDLNSYY